MVSIDMKRILTDAKLRNLKSKDKAYKVADGGGFYLFVTKAGLKSYRYDCTLNGKRFTLTIGTYPELSLADARLKHEQIRTDIANGIDPRAQKQQNKPFSYHAQETMKTLDLRPSTAYKRSKRMEKHLYPVLDKIPVTEITAIHLLNLLKPIAEQGKRETAQLLSTYCRQTFDRLLSLQLIGVNPAESIARLLPKPKQSTNFAHITDPQLFAELLRGIDSYTGDYAVKQALKLMPLVLLRPVNIRFLKWEYIDVDGQLLTIPADDMKMNRPHKVPLSRQALAIIESMATITGNDELVFLSGNGQTTKKAMSENTLNQALIRVKINGKPLGRGIMTTHGFRHTASTFLNEMGYNPDAVELQLAHASADRIRATYNKAELMPERTIMMQEWADYLDGLKAGADVVPFKKRA